MKQELSEHLTIEALDSFVADKEASQVDYSVREVYPLTGAQTYFGYILRGNTTSNLPFDCIKAHAAELLQPVWVPAKLTKME